ncbi:3-oxoacyl-[acyl-carrier-protein] synthase III C-terminal domain-containing protein [Micromonospora endophytica]|uniref:3-oxoacyl-ACP synthase n=1 Tax=Micromonospora endophytica TaxID=515350 RepID=A0A2W2CM34_9ACTN|nr:3-oxoacyl-[acyl-carrier-protein] synthase III C-terminal domain-containing protein [Micromonospora endophytica]PZG00562.1 3-oxoacyl-ACP synthase [Micromonospora endophytica]RIW45828.1 3-oxoacyl-ACP synthase [Micromonospora endophytica]BCJ61916.1 3-oxoacyl-ACP synthase [Micromonospora endophytica]
MTSLAPTRSDVVLRRVEAYAPERSVTVEEIAAGLGLNRYQTRLFRRIRGLDRLRIDPDLGLLDLVCPPAEALLAEVGDRDRIRYLIFAHTAQDLTPTTLVAADALRERLGLPDAEAFAVTQHACASGLLAIEVAGELLRAADDPDALALVLTGEQPFTRAIQVLWNTSIIGEASSACLVGLGGAGTRVLSYAARTVGEFFDGYQLAGAALHRFGSTYHTYLVEVIREALAAAELELADLTMVIPHNVNISSWVTICATLGLDRDRVFLDNVGEYSHCSCSDPFLNLATLASRGALVAGGRYLVTAVGLGATYSAMVVECAGS